jgi:hypothetical protein
VVLTKKEGSFISVNTLRGKERGAEGRGAPKADQVKEGGASSAEPRPGRPGKGINLNGDIATTMQRKGIHHRGRGYITEEGDTSQW